MQTKQKKVAIAILIAVVTITSVLFILAQIKTGNTHSPQKTETGQKILETKTGEAPVVAQPADPKFDELLEHYINEIKEKNPEILKDAAMQAELKDITNETIAFLDNIHLYTNSTITKDATTTRIQHQIINHTGTIEHDIMVPTSWFYKYYPEMR